MNSPRSICLPVLAEFRRLHPMIKITVRRSLGSHIPEDVLRHNCGTWRPHLRSAGAAACTRWSSIWTSWSSWFLPSHPLAGGDQVSIRQLGAESFVAHIVASPYREKVIEAFSATRLRCTWTWNCPRCRPSSASWPWGTAWRWCPRSAWKTNWPRRTGAHSGARAAFSPQTAAGVSQGRQPVTRRAGVPEGGGGIRASSAAAPTVSSAILDSPRSDKPAISSQVSRKLAEMRRHPIGSK